MRSDDALNLLRELVKQQGVSDEGMTARLDLGGKLFDLKQFTEAEAVVADILKHDARNTGGLKLSGALDMEKANFDAAISSLREAASNDPKDMTLRLLLASAYERKSSFELAAKELADAYKASNGDALVGVNYAGYLLRRGNADRAEEILSDLISRAPRNTGALKMLADIKLRKQDWKGAEDLARLTREQGGDTVVSDKIMGEALLGQKRFDEAIALFQTTARSAPSNVQPMFALVRAYITAGKTAEAEAFVRSAIEANPGNAGALILLGSVQMSQSLPAAAQASFAAAIAKDTASPAGYLAMAEFLARTQKRGEAAELLASSVDKVKDNDGMRLTLAGLLETGGDIDGAIQQYELLVASNPNSIVAVNNLVSLVSDHREDAASLKRAATLAAVLRESPVPQFRESLGWALVRSGDVKAGLRVLERSIDELGKMPLAQYHLGAAYAADGEKILASKHLNLALGMEKNPDAAARIKRALETLNATAAQ